MASWGRGRGGAAAAEEAMRVEVDVSLKRRELELLKEAVEGARGLAPVITSMGVMSKIVLAGAGGLVFLWGLSKFCSAVVQPYYSPRRKRGSPATTTPPASP